jgi:hypothetical protein
VQAKIVYFVLSGLKWNWRLVLPVNFSHPDIGQISNGYSALQAE